ncbi:MULTISPECIES: hypothetical protein [Pseudomonas]|uniref:hypothetical protein n=2 Tax=Pseudomonas TaxID=286 RepID=UPI00123B5AD4|nr:MULTISPECIES: hypothetical protein [Pseudomonas]MBA1248924.1 hypothetical protein [Pseudomonas zeshuii]QEU30747.1 hypothetical protein FOB45_24535 [Pseudomonas luteola]
MAILLVCAVVALFCFLLIREGDRSKKKQLAKDINPLFLNVLRQHNVHTFEILQDKLYPGISTGPNQKPFEVHRILYDKQGRYFLYLQIQDSPPTLMAISKERALRAIGR